MQISINITVKYLALSIDLILYFFSYMNFEIISYFQSIWSKG